MNLSRLRARSWLVAALLGGLALTSCGDNVGSRVIRVPADHPTIQAAVDEARPGDMVLIDAGSYHERVEVTRRNVTLRGVNRNDVILDGEDSLSDGIVVTADGVAIENLTVQHYRQNGVIFNGTASGKQHADDGVYGAGDAALVGYRASYVTAADNGVYGIYAFASRDGQIDHVTVSGSPDSGIYVGQCKPCNVVISDSVAEYNAIGYYGTNASGDVYVVNSIFRHNRLGMTPNSQKMELLAPQVETVIAGNLVTDNDDPAAPAIAHGFFGGGIAIGGGTKNLILHNRVVGHDGFGIGLVQLNDFDPTDNRVEGNVLTDNTLDLYVQVRVDEPSSNRNCFIGNDFTTSLPVDVERVLPCDGTVVSLDAVAAELPVAPPNVDYRQIPLPGAQISMPGDVEAVPTSPASAPPFPNLAVIKVPDPT